MSIGDYVPNVGERFIFKGVEPAAVHLGPWHKGGANDGKVVVVMAVAENLSLQYPYEIKLEVDTKNILEVMAVESNELMFLQSKPLEEWL